MKRFLVAITAFVALVAPKVSAQSQVLDEQGLPLVRAYKVGDIYNDGELEGVVFEVSADGKRGKIVSMTDSRIRLFWATGAKEPKRQVGATSQTNGKLNSNKIKAVKGWENIYQALKWCTDLGEGWYLPSKQELITIFNNRDVILPNLSDKFGRDYWSSTEASQVWEGNVRCAWYVIPMKDKALVNPCPKNMNRPVRAVAEFDCEAAARVVATRPKKKYRVGQYYNDGTKEGVIFEVTEDGNHGKIVSMTDSEFISWATQEADLTEFLGAESHTDGLVNFEAIKAVEGWETRYPGFKWCADLGEGWYLASRKELDIMGKNRNKIDPRLKEKLSVYWSSTEIYDKNNKEQFYVWTVSVLANTPLRATKKGKHKVRAVARF